MLKIAIAVSVAAAAHPNVDSFADCSEESPDCTQGGTVQDVCLQRTLESVADESNADYAEALAIDSGLSVADFTGVNYYKCYPESDAQALVDLSGQVDSIGVTAAYEIVVDSSKYPDVNAYEDCSRQNPECTDGSKCLKRVLLSVKDESNPYFKAALSKDDGLDLATYKDTEFLKCFPAADADASVSNSGIEDEIGVSANYEIIEVIVKTTSHTSSTGESSTASDNSSESSEDICQGEGCNSSASIVLYFVLGALVLAVSAFASFRYFKRLEMKTITPV